MGASACNNASVLMEELVIMLVELVSVRQDGKVPLVLSPAATTYMDKTARSTAIARMVPDVIIKMGHAFANLDGSESSVNKRALLDFSDLDVYNSVDVQMVEFAVTLMGLVLVLLVGLDSFVMGDAEKGSLGMNVKKYAIVRTMQHATI